MTDTALEPSLIDRVSRLADTAGDVRDSIARSRNAVIDHLANLENEASALASETRKLLRSLPPAQFIEPKDFAVEVEGWCEILHCAYETAAVGAGWETNPACRGLWADVPEANKITMRAAVTPLVRHMHILSTEIGRLTDEVLKGREAADV